MAQQTSTKPRLSSRAVLRRVEAGNSALCTACGEPVKFSAKTQRQQVICNVYVANRWDRVEHYHSECYEEAGSPFGEPSDQQVQRGRRAG